MTTTPQDTAPEAQREALDDAGKRAAESQPGRYRDAENGDKIVDVPPVDADSVPIRGLDP